MTLHAKVTLTALNGNIFPAERILNMDQNTAMVPVGRASKSISKGLFSGADNAWFDSPVMSREHAQITLDSETKTISITDIGSMHGTYRNDIELPRNVATTIDAGDVLVFGAEVRRGPETFPACGFSVKVEYTEIKSTNTFAFPESSDIEDAEGEDYDFSEDEQAARYESSQEKKSDLEPSASNSSRDNAIDLTGNDVSNLRKTNYIDLTDEKDIPVKDLTVGAPPFGIIKSVGQALIIESEDEDAGYSSDSSGASDHVSDDSEDSVNRNGRKDNFGLSEESDVDSEDMPAYGQSIADHDIDSSDDEEEIQKDDRDVVPHFAHTNFENTTIPLSDIRTRTQLPESIADEEDIDPDDNVDKESDFEVSSEAGELGIRALFEGDLLENELGVSSPSEYEPQSEPEHQIDIEVMEWSDEDVEVHASEPQTRTVLPPWKVSVDHSVTYATMQALAGHQLGLSTSAVRQPSPSDAAMVKTANSQPSESKYRFEFYDSAGESGPAQSLGEKTGKNAFFEAREVNKATVHAIQNSGYAATGSNSGKAPSLKATRPRVHGPLISPAPTIPTALPSVVDCTGLKFNGSFDGSSNTSHVPDFNFREPCSFLYKPDHMPVTPRAPSPQLDMTSAHSFNISKSTGLPQSSRGLKINDIIETSTTPQRTSKLKRKAEDISDVTDQELRSWAKASSDSIRTHSDSIIGSEITATDGNVIIQPPSANKTAAESRPTKRIRRFLENVGYVALGGVTVGAGLFTVLVATAPDFL